ncbi:hypothetical protein FGG08_004471 [Glutinoglossum americanum]|uniref:Uncharacterized protein n=1 Tax=Glutinoglossum americanum TaxID=1670608 RepID=A0A9P8I0A6_9PEZI|nr:hypothetical protein FGG08_004471 [Glutinoglossum americanum]
MSDQGSRPALKREDGESPGGTITPPEPTPIATGKRHGEPSDEPVKRQRYKDGGQQQQPDAASQQRLKAVIEAARWMMLLCFNHERWKDVLADVYGAGTDPHSQERQLAQKKILIRVASWKNKSINKMIAHVAELKDLDAMAQGSMASSQDVLVLYDYFMNSFNQKNFLKVFFFTLPFLDVDGSSPLGKYYLQNIYANLAIRCKLHHDIVVAKGGKERLSRKELLGFYNTMAHRTEFSEVDRSCFKERGLTVNKPKLPNDDPRYIILDPPPPKTNPSTCKSSERGDSSSLPGITHP